MEDLVWILNLIENYFCCYQPLLAHILIQVHDSDVQEYKIVLWYSIFFNLVYNLLVGF